MHIKKILAFACLAVFVFAGITAGKPPGNFHENLKVLPKDISQEDLDTVMEKMVRSLGVECGFCHVKNKSDTLILNFSSDENPQKEIARFMMTMTEKINQEFFDHKMTYKKGEIIAVSCYTCHNGSPRPEHRDKKIE
jgi:hypothetical protein